MVEATRTPTTEETAVLKYDITDHGLDGTVTAEIKDGTVYITRLSVEGPTRLRIPTDMGDLVCRILGKMRDEGDVPTTEEST